MRGAMDARHSLEPCKTCHMYHCAACGCRTVQVYDADNDRVITLTRAEAAAGMVRHARTLGSGTAACGEVERQAVELLNATGPV